MAGRFVTIVSLLMISSWTGLLVARGRFWDPPVDRLRAPAASGESGAAAPSVHVIVPARNEAAMLPLTLPALLTQCYAGPLSVTLADDQSTDGTAGCAATIAGACTTTAAFDVATVPPRPFHWAGKPWAMAAGVAQARSAGAAPDYWLFTDADIAHDREVVAALVATAQADRRDLVSVMVQLHCSTRWEQLLIPAFVFFFAKLYPFAWVADDRHATAAAAGGCILISDRLLRAIGGVERIGTALIDDCALAAAVKTAGGRLRLELSTTSRSVRPYDSLAEIWNMVARSAYTQLGTSPLVLGGTIAGMLFLYVLPLTATVTGLLGRNGTLGASGGFAWLLMSAAYVPVSRRYGRPIVSTLLLPLAAALYTLMTLDSAWRHWNGRGGAWKGRHYSAGAPSPAAPR